MSSLGGVAGAATAAAAAMYAVAVSSPEKTHAVPDDAITREKKHHVKGGKEFVNPWDSFVQIDFYNLIVKGVWARMFMGQGKSPDRSPSAITLPVSKPTFSTTRHSDSQTLRATWLGHACFYVEFPSGLRVLFDPVFEDCCVPFTMKKFARVTPVPCEIEDLPFVDVVVISHNHYDHLSYPTAQRIRKKFPEAHFFAPLGNKKWFEDGGVGQGRVTELDWWDVKDVTLTPAKDEKRDSMGPGAGEAGGNEEGISATISALPCQHTTGRSAFDKNTTLWASWSVESGGKKVYFAGDTGYRTVPRALASDTSDDYIHTHLPVCPAFAQIGSLRGPFDLGLIPIGAYEPRFMWSNVHANPKDAVNIFVDTKCKNALGMHWGTWVLTEEEVMEPPQRLKEACEWKGVEEGRFGVVGVGESREY